MASSWKRQEAGDNPHDLDCWQRSCQNTPTQADSLPHSLEHAAGGIGLYANADKTEDMCFNQRGDFFTLDDDALKQGDKFTYLRNNISFTENDINTHKVKAGRAIDTLSVI